MTWILFDWAGTLAFAVSGAMVGLSRRMDIFGVTVLALLTAVGGGMVRDVLAGVTPPVALTEPTDLLLSVATAVIVSCVYAVVSIDRKQRHTMTLLYELSDTIGLASFTVTGTLRGLTLGTGDPYVFPMMLGVITPSAAACCATSWHSACRSSCAWTSMPWPRWPVPGSCAGAGRAGVQTSPRGSAFSPCCCCAAAPSTMAGSSTTRVRVGASSIASRARSRPNVEKLAFDIASL
mgnify:CR=1 FL=1